MTEYDQAARLAELQAKDAADLTEDETAELQLLVEAAEAEAQAAADAAAEAEKPATPRRRRGKKADEDVEPGTKFCAYDLTHGRFVGAVTEDRDEAQSVIDNSALTDHDFEIRTVG